MEKLTNRLIVISFDGLSTLDFEQMRALPNFGEFINNAAYCKEITSIYPTLTYPAHTSIVTGKYPKNHGVINNTLLQPGRHSADWYWYRKYVKGDTLYDLAINKGMKVAALLWPVTAGSQIHYNMPEIFANRPWQNQIMVSLFAGSPKYQLQMHRRFGHLMQGAKQPNLDNYTHQSLLYTLKHIQPELTLVHYTDLDSMRHYNVFYSKEAKEALQRHDTRLGEIIRLLKQEKLYEDSTVVLLGDHSSLDEDKIIYLNRLFKEQGWMEQNKKGHIIKWRAICKTCDGSAYVYMKNRNDSKLKQEIKDLLEAFNQKYGCLEKIYSGREAAEMGADPTCTWMLEANKGYYFLDDAEEEVIRQIQPGEAGKVPHITVNTHGYSPFKPNYTTVFLAAGKGIKKGTVVEKMRLIDEGPTLARLLGVSLRGADGHLIQEMLDF